MDLLIIFRKALVFSLHFCDALYIKKTHPSVKAFITIVYSDT